MELKIDMNIECFYNEDKVTKTTEKNVKSGRRSCRYDR